MIRKETPCDLYGICPYGAENGYTCEYWCGENETQDYPEDWEEEGDDEDENMEIHRNYAG